tara:strand:- start:41 stop:526 length:486 start_codon:yes stop_codon:yes gene_type:complete
MKKTLNYTIKIIVISFFLLSNFSFAKTINLKGLDTFQFHINEFNECYVETSDIVRSIKITNKNSGINLIKFENYLKESLQITVMIQPATETIPSICVGYIKIEAGRYINAINTKGHGGPAPVFFYHKGLMFGSDIDGFKNILINNFEKMMKDFITEVKNSQ